MLKRIITVLLAAALLTAFFVPAGMADDAVRMYVYTENGRTLNLREAPSTSSKVLLQIPYGSEVWISDNLGNGWCYGHYGGEFGYMQTRFLVSDKPDPAPTPSKVTTAPAGDEKKALNELNAELRTLQIVSSSFMIAVRPARTSGWVNFRVGPHTSTARIAAFGEGKQLKVVGQTSSWYQAVDPDTNNTGFISKKYVSIVPVVEPIRTAAPESKQQLGELNVNGQFTLQCVLPEGYTLQLVSKMGTRIIAALNPADVTKPVLHLSISFDDTYAGVERMNDLTAEDLAILERSYTDMNQVEISYRETTYGTKLLVVRETGSDTDFVDILTIYKGYFIEFIMTPSTTLANKTLTDEQVAMCIKFLSDLDFVAVK